MENNLNKPIKVTQYKWAGSWGPFKIKSHCEECDLTTHRLRDLMKNDLACQNVDFEIKPWLDHAFYCLKKGAWHPPIILINERKFFQFSHKNPAFDKNALIDIVMNLAEQNHQ